MKLPGSRGFWDVLLIATGSSLMLQALGVLPVGALAWSVVFGVAALGFLYSVFRERDAYWWATIPGFALLGLAALTAWNELGPRSAEEVGAALLLGGTGLGFFAVYLSGRQRWWAIIPGGALIAAVAALDPVLGDAALADVLSLGIAITVALLAALPTDGERMAWPLFPAAGCALLAALMWAGATAVLNYVWPAALILGGMYMTLRAFGSGRRPMPGA